MGYDQFEALLKVLTRIAKGIEKLDKKQYHVVQSNITTPGTSMTDWT